MTLTFEGEEYVSGREAARIIGVNNTTFHDRCLPYLKDKGQLYTIPGYRWQYFKKSEVEKYDGPRTIKRKKA